MKFQIFAFFSSLFLFIVLNVAYTPVFAQDSAAAPEPSANSLDQPGFTFSLDSIVSDKIKGSQQTKWVRGGVNYFLERVITLMATLIGSVSLLMMMFGGFKMLTSVGNETEYKKGIDIIKSAAKGIAFALGAYILVTLVQILIRSIYA